MWIFPELLEILCLGWTRRPYESSQCDHRIFGAISKLVSIRDFNSLLWGPQISSDRRISVFCSQKLPIVVIHLTFSNPSFLFYRFVFISFTNYVFRSSGVLPYVFFGFFSKSVKKSQWLHPHYQIYKENAMVYHIPLFQEYSENGQQCRGCTSAACPCYHLGAWDT